MLLAAGEGSRLFPLTRDIPKPMLEIGGTPILEHNVRLLASHGVVDIVINLHYRPTSIVQHFGDGTRFGVRIRYSYEDTLLGTAGGLKKVEAQFADDDFYLVYGDNLTTLDLSALANLHRRSGAAVTMALFEREDPRASGIVALAPDDRIVRFLEKPSAKEIFSHWVNAGYLVVNPSVLATIATGTSDFGKDVFTPLLKRGARLYGYRMRETLWWIDSLEDYERTKRAAAAAAAQERVASA